MKKVKSLARSSAHFVNTMFNRVIMHFDGDAFFASVEQAKDYRLRGKPIVIGKDRFIATAFSYEAKARGIKRGMRIKEVKELCPEVILVSSDYLSYRIFARRMYAIVRRFTSEVEEYSIDECFADITDLDKFYKMSYEELGQKIKAELEMKLGITFGVGLAPNKVLAKVASKHLKPGGLTVIHPKEIQNFVDNLPIEKVWGIGPSMSTFLRQRKIYTAGDFARLPAEWLTVNRIGRGYREIWEELNGGEAKGLCTDPDIAQSIVRSGTFTPPSREMSKLLSELSAHIEDACERARSDNLFARAGTFYIKSQDFRYYSHEFTLPVPTNSPYEILKIVKENFSKIYNPRIQYRATGISLRGLITTDSLTYDLFGTYNNVKSVEKVFGTVDRLNKKFGGGTVVLASSLASSSKPSIRFSLPLLGTTK